MKFNVTEVEFDFDDWYDRNWESKIKMNRNYLIKEIKDLAKNFDDKTKERILNLIVPDHHFDNKELKSLYNELMEDVYGDGGIKGY